MNPWLDAFIRFGAGTTGSPFPAGARRWSDIIKWGIGAPSAGDSFTVTDKVIYDIPKADAVTYGDVIFAGPDAGFYADPAVPGGVAFKAASLVGMGGPTLQWGRPGVGFPQNGSFLEVDGIQSVGTPREAGLGFSDDGVSRSLMWDGPVTIEAAGPERLWTQLNGPIVPGDHFFPTAHDVSDWKVGARVAVAPSGYYDPGGNETKIFTIASVTSAGITFNEAAAYRYWGQLQYPWDAPDGTSGISLTPGLPFTRKAHYNTQTVIDERAEICLLSDGHTLEFRAPDDAEWNTVIVAANANGQEYKKEHGIHIMFMHGSVQKIRGLVIRRGGQAGRIGRYGLHSHMASYKPTTHVVTIDATGGNTIHWPGHGLPAGQPIKLTTTGKLLDALKPTDLPNPEAKFYILAAGLTPDSFRVGLWNGDTTSSYIIYNLAAAPVNATGTQNGVHSATVMLYTHDLVGEYWDRVRIDESGSHLSSVHGTCGLTVSNMVAIGSKGMGHMWGEDGVELRNVFRDNVSGLVRMPAPGFNLSAFDGAGRNYTEDQNGPSVYWLTHPDNIFIRNRGFDACRNGAHNAFSTLPNNASFLVLLETLSMYKNPTQYEDNVFHSNGVNMAETANSSGNRLGTLDRSFYRGEAQLDDNSTDLPANMPKWKRTFGYKHSSNGYNHSVLAPHIEGFVTADNTSLDFIGSTNPSGLIEQCLCIAYTLNDIGGRTPGSFQNDSHYAHHYAMTSYHGLVQIRDNTYINYPWQDGALHRQFDSGGGALSSRDDYLMGVFSNPEDWTGNTFINSHGGYLSESPLYAAGGVAPFGDMTLTTLAAPAATGATSVTLASVADCAVNAAIGVRLDNGDTWYSFVKSIVGNVVSMKTYGEADSPLPFHAASGNVVRTTAHADGLGRGPLRSYTIASVISNKTGIYGPSSEAAGGGRYYVLNQPFFVAGITGAPNSPRMAVAGENGILTDHGYSAIGAIDSFYGINAVSLTRLDPANIASTIAETHITPGWEGQQFSTFHFIPFPDGSHLRLTHPGRIPQGSGVNGADDFYYVGVQSADRPEADFTIEMPWDAQAVPNPSQVFKVRTTSGVSFNKLSEYLADPRQPPLARMMTPLNLAGIPGGTGATKQQIVNALRSDAYNPLADKYWVDVAGQAIVMRFRGYNTDGVTRNLWWAKETYITTQDYHERNVAIWAKK